MKKTRPVTLDTLGFHLGETVYLRVNTDQVGMITGIVFRPNGIAYYATFADGQERTHFECELTTEKTYHEQA